MGERGSDKVVSSSRCSSPAGSLCTKPRRRSGVPMRANRDSWATASH